MKRRIDPVLFYIAIFCYVLSLVGFILANTLEPDAINMGIGSLIAAFMFTVLGRILR